MRAARPDREPAEPYRPTGKQLIFAAVGSLVVYHWLVMAPPIGRAVTRHWSPALQPDQVYGTFDVRYERSWTATLEV